MCLKKKQQQTILKTWLQTIKFGFQFGEQSLSCMEIIIAQLFPFNWFWQHPNWFEVSRNVVPFSNLLLLTLYGMFQKYFLHFSKNIGVFRDIGCEDIILFVLYENVYKKRDVAHIPKIVKKIYIFQLFFRGNLLCFNEIIILAEENCIVIVFVKHLAFYWQNAWNAVIIDCYVSALEA